MLVTFPVSHHDFSQALDLLEWIVELDPALRSHKFLIVAGARVSDQQVRELFDIAKRTFGSGTFIRQREDSGRGWPYEPNQMFALAAKWVAQNQAGHFFWCESDCIPLCPGWLNTLESKYRVRSKPFMGAMYEHPQRHLNGCMVYPQSVGGRNPYMINATTRPWDLMAPDVTLKYGTATELIQRKLADPKTNTPMSFADQPSLGAISPKAVVFHGVKDGSLIQRLRERGITAGNGHIGGGNFDQDDTLERMIVGQTLPSVKRRLAGVTLWAICWSSDQTNLDSTVRVLEFCRKWFDFDEIVLFAHLPVAASWCRYIQIPHLTMDGFNIFVNRVVPLVIQSRFAMSVHEDGFPIMPSLWRDEFLDYDYIGAPWSDGVVGNGGFNIESRRLMMFKMDLPPYPQGSKIASDYYVCRVHRKALEAEGIRFAPVDVAVDFSTELTGHEWPSFGYHGRRAQPHKYRAAWKLIERAESETKSPIFIEAESRAKEIVQKLIERDKGAVSIADPDGNPPYKRSSLARLCK